MVLVDEFLALRALIGRPPSEIEGEVPSLTYSRAYRLTRALLEPGPNRPRIRGRFSRVADALPQADRLRLHLSLTAPDPDVLRIIDPRPLILTAGTIQNTYPVSLLQAETLAAAMVEDRPLMFQEHDSAPEALRRAVSEIGLDLTVLDEIG